MDRGRLKWFTEGEYTGRLEMSTKKEEKSRNQKENDI